MKFFPCIAIPKKKLDDEKVYNPNSPSYSETPAGDKKKSPISPPEHGRQTASLEDNQKAVANVDAISAHSFTFEELAVATKKFRHSRLIGEGGFGKVYKGCLDDGTIVAIKKLSLDGLQGNQEFMVEVLMLSLLHHPNLVTLIGYCAEGDQRLLVYEYMHKGSLADHLFDAERYHKDVLDWSTRIKIAAGAARGLEYLHSEAKPPVIYRDLKSANILLDKDYNPKLSDFGLAKLGPVGDNTHVSTRVMGTYGYCAPEYALSGKLTLKSDIFSFGIVLLEIVTGRKAYDITKRQGRQSLAACARPFLKDRQRCIELMDPQLKGKFPSRSARHLIAVIAMCLNSEPSKRPSISEVVVALDFIANEYQSPSASSSNSSSSGPLQSQSTPKEDSPKEQTQNEDSYGFCKDRSGESP